MAGRVGPQAGSPPDSKAGRGRYAYEPGEATGRAGAARICERLAAALVPKFADFAAVHLVEEPPPGAGEQVRMRRVAVRRGRTAGRYLDSLPAGEVIRWVQPSTALAALNAGESVHVPCVDAATADQLASEFGVPGLAAVLHSASVLLLPLVSGGEPAGFVLLLCGPDRAPCHGGQIPALEELVTWAAEQMDDARRAEIDLALAEALQDSAGPRRPGPLPGLELAFRYLPPRGEGLGGDWFDALPLPGGRVALVVGDVEGHGPRAAVRMSECRSMVRALAGLDMPPERLMHWLDQLARGFGEPETRAGRPLVTCVYVVCEPSSGRCRMANAGHVPVVLVRPDGGAEVLRQPAGAPLGVGGVEFESVAFTVPPGSLLALYTDGLVDGGRDLGNGIRILAARLAGPPRPLEEACDAVLTELGSTELGERRDDATLLLARLTAPGASPVRQVTVTARAEPPPEDTGLVGRDLEVQHGRRLLEAARLVTLTGVAGVGKSRLARRIVARLGAEYPDGIRLVELASAREAHQLPHAVNEALDAGRRAALPDLEDKRMLLLLDNCEHLADACAVFTRSLLRAAPRLRVLVTSRQVLSITGEHTLAVPPLAEDEAVALLVGRAAARGIRLTEADLVAARELCRRLDRLPLAIELAAQRLDGPVAGLLERMEDRFGLLVCDGPVFPPHHQSLRAAIGRSHELCDPLERLLWARLSVFAGPFELADAEVVCADEALLEADVLTLLSGLVAKSVVVRGDGATYRLPGLLREYGAGHLAQLPGQDALRQRHHDWSRGR